MSGPELRLVELRMPSGTWYTVRQNDWMDADDESGPFLARGGQLDVFRSPADVIAWCAAPDDTEHELAPSPLWQQVGDLTATVREEDRFDLTWSAVPSEGPVAHESVASLQNSAAVLDDLLTATELLPTPDVEVTATDADLQALWEAPELVDLLYDPARFDGAMSGRRREHLADLLRTHGAAVVRLVERRLSLPEPVRTDPAAAGAAVPAGAAPGSELRAALPLEDVAGVETVWIGLEDTGFYTMREATSGGDAPAYLGSAGRLLGAADLAALRGWLGSSQAVDGPHDLLTVPGWTALTADPMALDLEPYDDDVVDVAEVGDSFDPGLDESGAQAMTDAWLLLADLADWGGWDDVRDALEPDRPVGHVLSAAVPEILTGDPRGARRLELLDMDEVRTSWASLMAAVARRVDMLDPTLDPARSAVRRSGRSRA